MIVHSIDSFSGYARGMPLAASIAGRAFVAALPATLLAALAVACGSALSRVMETSPGAAVNPLLNFAVLACMLAIVAGAYFAFNMAIVVAAEGPDVKGGRIGPDDGRIGRALKLTVDLFPRFMRLAAAGIPVIMFIAMFYIAFGQHTAKDVGNMLAGGVSLEGRFWILFGHVFSFWSLIALAAGYVLLTPLSLVAVSLFGLCLEKLGVAAPDTARLKQALGRRAGFYRAVVSIPLLALALAGAAGYLGLSFLPGLTMTGFLSPRTLDGALLSLAGMLALHAGAALAGASVAAVFLLAREDAMAAPAPHPAADASPFATAAAAPKRGMPGWRILLWIAAIMTLPMLPVSIALFALLRWTRDKTPDAASAPDAPATAAQQQALAHILREMQARAPEPERPASFGKHPATPPSQQAAGSRPRAPWQRQERPTTVTARDLPGSRPVVERFGR